MTFAESLFSVAGKSVLVTGGTSGIGLMIAEGFVRSGARVYVVSRKEAVCREVEATLSAQGTAKALPVDIGTPEGRKACVEWVSALEPSGLDVLVNNAGTTWGAPMENYTEDAWDRVMGLNVKAPFFLTRDLLPLLARRGTRDVPARVINVTSIAGQQPASLMAYAYGPSKAALNQLTRILANELVHRNITVNAIAPGFFPSRMTAHLRKTEEMEQALASQVPMKRTGKLEDVAGLAIYLASAAGAYMTGNVIALDGGMLLRS